MIVVVGFLLSFIAAFGGTFAFMSQKETSVEVLAVSTPEPTTEPSPNPTPTESPEALPNIENIEIENTPTSTPTLEPSAKPTLKPTISPAPTKLPTTKPSPTPSPTLAPTQTPQVQSLVAPTSTPDVWSPANLEPFFIQYAGVYGVDKNVLERIANCESHFNPNAQNGDYLGLFQFATNTWISNRSEMGLNTNPSLRTNSEESIKTGAYLVSKKGTSPWPSCL